MVNQQSAFERTATAMVIAWLIFVFPGVDASAQDGNGNGEPVFPYGAVYFRKSNPPMEDWERDYETAAKLGVNCFRHWFMWSAIEVKPGEFDWADYDQQMDLAARNDIKVIIGELSSFAPEWMAERFETGSLSISASAAVGHLGVCLDNDEVLRAAEGFQRALVEHYRDHPALFGYDLWNELHYGECHCEHTQTKFREWLKKKYGSLEALGEAWHRYSMGNWENVRARRTRGGYPDALDWVEFHNDNKSRLLRRRVALFRKLDTKHLVTGHSAFAARITPYGVWRSDWRDAVEFDVFGYTWVASRNGNQPWMQFQAVDFVRAAARGKRFWHAEAEAGSLWMQPQVPGRAREDGRISDAKDVRIWNMVSMATGATGILYPRWRPLLDGPLWGAFGPMNLDGSVGPKAEMAGKVARWANTHPELWRSRPVKGDIGIVWVPETPVFDYCQLGETTHHSQSMRGVYQGFFDSNIQPDFVHIDDIQEYPVVYLPYPVMLKQETARKLTEYVAGGGRLISEGCPGYFGDGGHVGDTQPNLGLDKLFGASERYVEFVPDLLTDLTLKVRESTIPGHYFRQEYELTSGRALGHYHNGSIAAVENSYGQGKTLLIGTFPGAGYFDQKSPQAKAFFAGLLAWAEVRPRLQSTDDVVKARLFDGQGGKYLWVLNPSRQRRTVRITIPELRALNGGVDLWQDQSVSAKGQSLTITVSDRDAAVIQLRN